MPIYTYSCDACGWRGIQVAKYDERDLMTCPKCSSPIVRDGVEKPSDRGHHGAFQMKAVTSSGAHIKGHFGKSAKTKKGSGVL